MMKLPENWEELTFDEQDMFFTKYYRHFLREGEYVGLREDTPQEIVDVYEKWMTENHDRIK